jgi:SAM-dependent methyltransferase
MLNKYFYILSKKASRKNLYKFIYKSLKKNLKKNHKILNIGAGGEIEEYIKKFSNNIYSIDIDKRRKPNQVLDICDDNFIKKLNYKPSIVFCFEVLEHTENPIKAVENIFGVIKKGDRVLVSVPFNFHIHDEPIDYYRFTQYGLKLLLKKFSKIEIKKRNGWLESIFVNFIRLEKEKNRFAKLLGRFFIVLYFLLYPIIIVIQKIFISDKLTTGYFVEATK